MYDFLLQTSFFLSIGAILYLMARAVPRVSDAKPETHAPGVFDKLLSKLPLGALDERLEVFFEKSLRRVKVLILKLDNLINRYLGRFKKNSGPAGGNGSGRLFKDADSDKKE